MCVSVCQGGIVEYVCVFASYLCMYDLMKGDLFVLSWPSV